MKLATRPPLIGFVMLAGLVVGAHPSSASPQARAKDHVVDAEMLKPAPAWDPDPRARGGGKTAVTMQTPRPVVGNSSTGTSLITALGPYAARTLAPATGRIGALVALPKGARAQDYGLEPAAPGIGRLRASPARVEAFGAAHPELHVEVAPPLHLLLDRTAQWVASAIARRDRAADGRGVMVGVADTGLDVTHPEFRDAQGRTRVAWLLDLSLKPLGVYPELEDKYGIKDDAGTVTNGAVLDRAMIDSLLKDIGSGACKESDKKKCAPSDEIGHGTHVTGIAASTGATTRYSGVAPSADILFVRLTQGRSDGIDNDDLTRGVQFMFDRGDAEKKPTVVNISLGADFGPHDGTFLWEQVIASYVGADHPGHAVVAAAGNSGSVVEMAIHQSVRVTRGGTMRVPIHTQGADSGSVQVWVTLRSGADLKIGLDGPDGEWIAPIEEGHQNAKDTNDYNAGVIYGSGISESPIPAGSRGAVVIWTGKWPSGTYNVTLEGAGMAELYLQGIGDAGFGADREVSFVHGVREGTVNLPATHPLIIGVGCTVNRPRWTSIANVDLGLRIPLLDAAGGLPGPRRANGGYEVREVVEGEVCWFSSAGPTATGVPKPEISAPGALVVSALSRTAKPGARGSVFTSGTCPDTKTGQPDARCMQIDETHGIAQGTSMSSPVVAGVVALLLQKDPTLTQEQIMGLLQAGAHPFRGPAAFFDQSGPGEVDAWGSLDALDQMHEPKLYLPAAAQSWITLSADYVAADGSTPFTAIIELRTEDGQHRADLFETNRLGPVLLVDGKPLREKPAIVRRAPGVYFYVWQPPPGLGGSRATLGATFDGQAIVAPRTVPIASDVWNASYPSHATGSACNVHAVRGGWGTEALSLGALGVLAAIASTARRRRPATPRRR